MVPSVRNAEAGQLHVLKEAECTKMIHSAGFSGTVEQLKEKKPDLQSLELASLEELIDTPSKYYPYTKKWQDSWKDPVIIAHSSGSTGQSA